MKQLKLPFKKRVIPDDARCENCKEILRPCSMWLDCLYNDLGDNAEYCGFYNRYYRYWRRC